MDRDEFRLTADVQPSARQNEDGSFVAHITIKRHSPDGDLVTDQDLPGEFATYADALRAAEILARHQRA